MALQPLKLYYAPVSFYSQKVLIALKEKRLPYSEQVVVLPAETSQPWFLRVNPKGQIPVLQVGSRTVVESERIIEEVDAMPAAKGVDALIPKPGTTEAAVVSSWRHKLDSVAAPVITFGVMLNKELHMPETKPFVFLNSKEAFTQKMKDSIPMFEKLKEENPDLGDAIDAKIAACKVRSGNKFDLQNIQAALNDLYTLMNEVDSQLKSSRATNQDWLCGQQFTAADINLCVLLGRLDMLGYLTKTLEKRPALAQYWQKALQRPTVATTVTSAAFK